MQDAQIPEETEMVNTGGAPMRFPIDGVNVLMKPGEFRKFRKVYK